MDDEELQMELDALIWRESGFKENAAWASKDVMSKSVLAALEQRKGKFEGERFVYYLSKSGNLTRYWKLGESEKDEAEYERNMPEPDKRVRMGARAEPLLCPECGRPMDREHRGQHHHE